jgi:hypothetical protein
MAMAAAGLLMLGVSAFIGVSRGVVPSVSSAPPITSANAVAAEPSAPQNENQIDKNDRTNETKTLRESPRPAMRENGSPRAARSGGDSQSVASAETQNPEQKASSGEAVKVILRVENGRVTEASIGNRKPGMEAYEAMALRIARQRRYPAAASGQQTVMIKVD